MVSCSATLLNTSLTSSTTPQIRDWKKFKSWKLRSRILGSKQTRQLRRWKRNCAIRWDSLGKRSYSLLMHANMKLVFHSISQNLLGFWIRTLITYKTNLKRQNRQKLARSPLLTTCSRSSRRCFQNLSNNTRPAQFQRSRSHPSLRSCQRLATKKSNMTSSGPQHQTSKRSRWLVRLSYRRSLSRAQLYIR